MSNQLTPQQLAHMQGEVLITLDCDAESCAALKLTSLRFQATCKPTDVAEASSALRNVLVNAGLHGTGRNTAPPEKGAQATPEQTQAGLAQAREAIERRKREQAEAKRHGV